MTEVFEEYSKNTENMLEKIGQSMSHVYGYPLSKKETILPSFRGQMFEIEKQLKLMQTEAVSFHGKQKNLSFQKIKSFKTQYQNLRKKLKSIENQIQQQRSKIQQNQTTSHSLELSELTSKKSKKNRYTKLQNQTHPQRDINDKLHESVKLMHENLSISDNVQVQLVGHTERMESNKNRLGMVRNQLAKGQKKIKNMMIRVRRHKAIYYGVLLMGVIMTIFILWKLIF